MSTQIELPDFVSLTVLPNQEFKKCWEELVGIDELKEQLLNYLILSINRLKVKEWYWKHYGKLNVNPIKFGSKILFLGPSGTGKTTLAKGLSDALSRKLGRELYFIDIGIFRSKFVGVTSKNIITLFTKVRELAKEKIVVLFFDEFDTVASTRQFEEQHEEIRASVNTLIKEIDKTKESNVIIIAASNLEAHVNVAVKRRFDLIIKFQRPTEEERALLFHSFLKDFDLSQCLIQKFAKKTEYYTHADIKKIATLSIIKAISEDRPLKAKDVFDTIKEVKPTGEYG